MFIGSTAGIQAICGCVCSRLYINPHTEPHSNITTFSLPVTLNEKPQASLLTPFDSVLAAKMERKALTVHSRAML